MEGGRILNSQSPWEWYSDDVITVQGDTLALTYRENPREVKHHNGKIYHPTIERAMFRTEEAFGYGTFSADIRLPKGKNITSSFWLSGNGNWPPEIDICEAWWKNTCLRLFSWNATNNVHYRNELLEHQHITSKGVSWLRMCDPRERFYNYACRWEPDKITFYINGKVVREVYGYVCNALTTNLSHPEKGYEMNIIINCGAQYEPSTTKTVVTSPMLVKNVKYLPL